MGRNITQEMEQDITNFLNKIDILNQNDLRDAIRLLLEKHLQLEESDYLLDKFNFHSIVSRAKNDYVGLPTRVDIEEYSLTYEDKRLLCIVNATISELRQINVLKKIVKFKLEK